MQNRRICLTHKENGRRQELPAEGPDVGLKDASGAIRNISKELEETRLKEGKEGVI